MNRLLQLFPALLVAMLIIGCRPQPITPQAIHEQPPIKVRAVAPSGPPIIRVRVMQNQPSVLLWASEAPIIHTSTNPQPKKLAMTTATLSYGPAGWTVGRVALGHGVLTVEPSKLGSVSVNRINYRGSYRFVPVSSSRFDVINDVEVDSYLKSVISKELYKGWHSEAYRAQAIVARSYAIYEARSGSPNARYYDLEDDQRSQAYGGIPAETDKSRQAVDSTRGIVVASGPEGDEKVIKAYFSACCGGIGQSASDAFGDPPSPELIEQNHHNWCAGTPKFTWRLVALTKNEITRRLRTWGARNSKPVREVGSVYRIDIAMKNSLGRPVKFYITDTRSARYLLTGEELRHAMNIESTTLYSSFFRPENLASSIVFADGHGFGHGVGLCQWCAEIEATHGIRHEDIVVAAYPGSKLIRAY